MSATTEKKRIRADVPQMILDEINRVDWSRVPEARLAQVKDKLKWAISFLGLPVR